MFTYEITPELIVNVYDPDGNLINWPGPWQIESEAKEWADQYIAGLNDGSITWPPVEEND